MEFHKRNRIKNPDSIANSEKNYYEQTIPDFDYHSEPVYSSNKQAKPKAIITLNIGDSLEQLKIYEGQDLYDIAAEFANKHDLTEDFIDFLIENIESMDGDYSTRILLMIVH